MKRTLFVTAIILCALLTLATPHSFADTRVYGPVGDQAGDITNTPSGNISATTIQGAINELDAEKATGNQAVSTTSSVTFGSATATNIRNASEYPNTDCSSTRTIDWNNGNKQRLTLVGNCAITFIPPSSGVGNLQLRLFQGGSGSYTATFTDLPYWLGAAAPTLSTTVGRKDMIGCFWDGTEYDCWAGIDFRRP